MRSARGRCRRGAPVKEIPDAISLVCAVTPAGTAARAGAESGGEASASILRAGTPPPNLGPLRGPSPQGEGENPDLAARRAKRKALAARRAARMGKHDKDPHDKDPRARLPGAGLGARAAGIAAAQKGRVEELGRGPLLSLPPGTCPGGGAVGGAGSARMGKHDKDPHAKDPGAPLPGAGLGARAAGTAAARRAARIGKHGHGLLLSLPPGARPGGGAVPAGGLVGGTESDDGFRPGARGGEEGRGDKHGRGPLLSLPPGACPRGGAVGVAGSARMAKHDKDPREHLPGSGLGARAAGIAAARAVGCAGTAAGVVSARQGSGPGDRRTVAAGRGAALATKGGAACEVSVRNSLNSGAGGGTTTADAILAALPNRVARMALLRGPPWFSASSARNLACGRCKVAGGWRRAAPQVPPPVAARRAAQRGLTPPPARADHAPLAAARHEDAMQNSANRTAGLRLSP